MEEGREEEEDGEEKGVTHIDTHSQTKTHLDFPSKPNFQVLVLVTSSAINASLYIYTFSHN